MLAPSAFPLEQTIDRHPLTVTRDTPVLQVITQMSQVRASCALVVDQNQLQGIFTERDVVRISADGVPLEGKAIAEVMTTNLVTFHESKVLDILEVLSVLRQYRIRHLPIVNDQRHVTGVVTHQSIREVLQPVDLLKLRRVAEVMSTKVVAAAIHASVSELTQLMARHTVSCVVITAVEESNPSVVMGDVPIAYPLKPVGIVTERDIVQLRALGVDFSQTLAKTVMSTPLLPISPEAPLWAAHDQMRHHRIRRLVVVGESGELMGLVTQSSLLQVLDPLEMCTALDALQRVVEERTTQLQRTNEQLQNEIQERQKVEQALHRQIDRERLVNAIAQRIRQSLHLSTILETTVAEVRQFLQADRVLVYRFNTDWTGFVTVESVVPQYLPTLGKILHDICFAAVAPQYQQGRLQAIADIDQANLTPCHRDLLAQFQVRANLVAPILHGEDLWGLLIVHQCAGPRRWEQWEVNLLQQLSIQVGIAIQQAQLYQQLEAANQELQRLATSDGLTQVANRRHFDEYLHREWRRMTRERLPLSLILCDIDFFKPYNDTYGHQGGDDCLKQVAGALRSTLKRPADLVARYGGEEFAVIMPNTTVLGAVQVAQEIHFRVKTLKIPHIKSPISPYITLSLGIAGMIPTPDFCPADLIQAADKALYQAKAEGRDRVYCDSL